MKKLLTVLLTILLVFCVVSCKDEPHYHEYGNLIVEVPATCTTAGTKAHYHCDGCGKDFDINHHELTDLVIPATGHDADFTAKGKCTTCGTYKTYAIGATGPACGYIFYDCDADNVGDGAGPDGLKSSACGWRYMEVATTAIGQYKFGYFRETSDGDNWYVNESTVYDEDDCTLTAIGKGKYNTGLLFGSMGTTCAWENSTGVSKYNSYAARMAKGYAGGGFFDWFLPSLDELKLVYTNIKQGGFCTYSTDYYWTSSEHSNSVSDVYRVQMGDGSQYANGRGLAYVLPVRSF